MLTRIKICGITNRTDALLAAELGANLLGFNFYPPSPRYISPADAADIIASLPASVITVGVFVNTPADAIGSILAQCPLHMAQLHGDETNDDCRQTAELGVKVIKALRLRQPDDIRRTAEFDTDTLLLDAFNADLYGGTGHSFDWSWIRQIDTQQNIFLAGGINPQNVTEALSVGTYGIDLAGGVEREPGRKDHALMKLLFERIAGFQNRY